MMRQLPDLLYPNPANRAQPAYHSAFQYALFAYQEALLRFPAAPQADDWRWGLAFSLAQTGSSKASPLYARLINSAIENRSLRIADLAGWFKQQEPEFDLSMHQLPGHPGYLGLYLMEIEPGNMYFWVTETPNAIKIYALAEEFLFDTQVKSVFLYQDLNGDGMPELVIYRQTKNDNRLYEPEIYDFSSGEPVRQALENRTPFDFKTSFEVSLDCPGCQGEAGDKLLLQAKILPACPLILTRSYAWDGSRYAVDMLSFTAVPQEATLAYCETTLAQADSFYPLQASMAVLNALEPYWPPKLDLKGRLYPADSLDMLHFRQGLGLGLLGDTAGMRSVMFNLPGGGAWQAAARPFLQAQNPGQLFTACQTEPACKPRQALEAMLEKNSPGSVEQAFAFLFNQHIGMVSSGIFDFNQDGQNERWFTLKLRAGETLEFWLLVQTKRGVRLLNVATVDNTRPQIYFSVMDSPWPTFQFTAGQGYILQFTPDKGDASIDSVEVDPTLTTYTLDNLNAAQQSLFNGVPAAAVRDRLRGVVRSGRFNCRTHQVCDRFYYLLGLTYELAGQPLEARDTYIQLWWENKTSPFTTLARLKLGLFPTATPIPQATLTSTPTATPQATPTITSTPNPNTTATLTPTFTETSEAYPLESYTPTPTTNGYP